MVKNSGVKIFHQLFDVVMPLLICNSINIFFILSSSYLTRTLQFFLHTSPYPLTLRRHNPQIYQSPHRELAPRSVLSC